MIEYIKPTKGGSDDCSNQRNRIVRDVDGSNNPVETKVLNGRGIGSNAPMPYSHFKLFFLNFKYS